MFLVSLKTKKMLSTFLQSKNVRNQNKKTLKTREKIRIGPFVLHTFCEALEEKTF